MSFWQQLQYLFGGKPRASSPRPALPSNPPPPSRVEDEPELPVPEITVEELAAARTSSAPPMMIDIREPYEWRMVRMPAARHIPMNEVPVHLDTLPRDQPIVVICAHGSRSYSMAAWLNEQGFTASSLAGGITQWARQGGEVEQGAP
jgi:rhodanese-related sulfurtransferase